MKSAQRLNAMDIPGRSRDARAWWVEGAEGSVTRCCPGSGPKKGARQRPLGPVLLNRDVRFQPRSNRESRQDFR